MPNPDGLLLSYVVSHDALNQVRAHGIGLEHFVDEHQSVWRYLVSSYERHGALPSEAALSSRFPRYEIEAVEERDVPDLVHQLHQRKKYKELLALLTDAAGHLTDFETVDEVMVGLQSELTTLAMRNGTRAHLVNIFAPDAIEFMVGEMRSRNSARVEQAYIKTGLDAFDRKNSGLRKQQMVVIIGRTGLGKSWLDLLFVAHAVMQGKSVLLYPLEMTLYDTACRLYTIFTQEMFGPSKVLRNMELQLGNVNARKVRRFLLELERRLPGAVDIADMATTDAYTVEKIEAEVASQHPDMFWVDYLTLLKAPAGIDARKDYEVVRQLSNGIKAVAMRANTVGGCSAQVNREALKVASFIPRLEHIAYGDSIGQDADLVFSINRKRQYLYWKLVKNRSGAEIGQHRLTWEPDIGYFHEVERRGHEVEESG